MAATKEDIAQLQASLMQVIMETNKELADQMKELMKRLPADDSQIQVIENKAKWVTHDNNTTYKK